MIYSFDSRIRFSEVGEDARLTLPGIIDYFQDCSTFHSEDLGVGLEFLSEQDHAWILAYWHIEVMRQPELGEKVTIYTAPYEFKTFFGKRNFWMKDDKGELLARADSLWIFMDMKSGKPARVNDEVMKIYGQETPLDMEELPRKIAVPKESTEQEAFTVVKSHLDTNHHVNNAQYIYMAEQYLPKNVQVKRLRVEYRKSAVLHDMIHPWVDIQDGQVTVSLCDDNKKPYAVLEFQLG